MREKQVLNMVADYVESLCEKIKMPCSIAGGTLHTAERTIELTAAFASDPLVNPQRCNTLSKRLCDTFGAENAGVDVDGRRVWIYRISQRGGLLCE